MKVLSISVPAASSSKVKLATMLLEKQRFNDPLFESITFPIEIKLDHMSQAYDRLYWETCCTKTDSCNGSLRADGTYVMYCTLAECINTIYQCTPPRFQKQVQDSMKTMEDVRDILNMYIRDTATGYTDYYLDIFKKVVHLEYTDTGFRPDFAKIELISKCVPNSFVVLVDASTISFDDIMHKDATLLDGAIQMTFQGYGELNYVDMHDFISRNRLIVDRVYEDNKYGVCVSCFTTIPGQHLFDKIRECYALLVK